MIENLKFYRFSAMIKWARNKVKSKKYSNKIDAKEEFRCCMERLTRDLKLYRIPPTDLIKVRPFFQEYDLSACTNLPYASLPYAVCHMSQFTIYCLPQKPVCQAGSDPNPRALLVKRRSWLG